MLGRIAGEINGSCWARASDTKIGPRTRRATDTGQGSERTRSSIFRPRSTDFILQSRLRPARSLYIPLYDSACVLSSPTNRNSLYMYVLGRLHVGATVKLRSGRAGEAACDGEED